MLITSTGIYAALMILAVTLPRSIYFLITNIRKYPTPLFKGRYLLSFLLSIFLEITIFILTLFFSGDFFYFGVFFSWALISGTFVCFHFGLWIIFWMHGYEARYQFKKVVVPVPMNILASATIILTGACSLNYWVIGCGLMYTLISFYWNYEGDKLTKPAIPDDVILKEDDE